ncbi:MAG TPA: two component regulator propeller domain protein, partial [Saprospiraceae bacterium]|nr:two component regulator propeller domain protein [Saprospiraceae bacterium]
MKKILLIFFLFSICFLNDVDSQGSLNLYFDHLTIKEGLSHNTVNCVIQDKYGYIWIGTNNGLNKYDGFSFKYYNNTSNGNTKFFKGKHISDIFEDSKGNLWVGTKNNGINFKRFDKSSFINLNNDPRFIQIKNSPINSIKEDNNGNIWICTMGKGLLKYIPSNKTVKVYNKSNTNLYSNVVFDVLEDHKKRIWVATEGPGINLLKKNEKFQLLHSNDQGDISGYRKVLKQDRNNIWIGVEGSGLYKMSKEN